MEDLAVLLLLLSSSFFTSGLLRNISGVSAGNGDLPYYSALAKLLSGENKNFTGWVQNFDMRVDLFIGWGYGGSGGASNLAFSSLVSGQGIAESYLPTFISYLILIGSSFYYLLKTAKFSVSQRIIISVVSSFNVFTLYLVSQGFTQMFISLIAVMAYVLMYEEFRNPSSTKIPLILGILIGFFLPSFAIYIAYPIFGAPFVGILFLLLGIKLNLRIRKKQISTEILPLIAAGIGVVLPIIFWPERIIQIISLLPLYTSGAPGWDFQIARPTSLVGISRIGDNWESLDVVSFILFLIFTCHYIIIKRNQLNPLLITYFFVSLSISLVFTVRDGNTAYTAWKASYFLVPFAVFFFLSHLIDLTNEFRMKESTRRGVLLRRIVVTLPILIILTSSAFVAKSLADKTIPMYEAPNKEIKSLISKSQNSNSLFIALGPLEQLWSIYLTDRTINLLAQNTHVSSQKVKIVMGDYFIVFKDEKLNANFCPNFQKIDFETIESTTWFELTKSKTTKEFTCM